MERIGGFGGVGDQMNGYYADTGNPGYFSEDLSRYSALSPGDISAMATRYLALDKRDAISAFLCQQADITCRYTDALGALEQLTAEPS